MPIERTISDPSLMALPPLFKLEYGRMDGDRWRGGTISDASGNRKKKWRDDADLKRKFWKRKLKRERRSGEIERRERGENDKVEKEEDNTNTGERKIRVGALPLLSSCCRPALAVATQ
jgi:hypothetical protein